MTKSIEEIIQPGNKVRIFYGKDNINNSVIHIRAIVDNDFIVARRWLTSKQYWYYFVESMIYYQVKKDYITLIGKSKGAKNARKKETRNSP